MRLENIAKIMRSELDSCVAELNAVKKELRGMPKGCMVMREKQGRKYYYRKAAGKEKGITNDQDSIRKLCRKRYLICRRRRLEECMAYLRKHADDLPEMPYIDIIKNFSRTYGDFPDEYFLTPANAGSWASAAYPRNGKYPENRIHVTSKGIRMRSKAEQLIGNLLEARGIHYRYEWVQDLDGVRVSPDFAIKRAADGKIVFWEHFGMTSSEKYVVGMEAKLARFRKAGITLWDDLIITFDDRSGAADIQLMNRIIDLFLT